MKVHPDSLDRYTESHRLPNDYIEYYQANGFVKVPGIVPRVDALRIGERCRAISDEARRTGTAQGGGMQVFTQVVNTWRADEAVREAVFHPNITAVAKQLAGGALRLWHDHILVKEPRNEAATEWHQDQPYWPHANSTRPISCWLALVDVPADRGSMSFIPGVQHRDDIPRQTLTDKRSLFSLAPDLEYLPKVTLPLKAGDCTFHHGRTPHMANANATDDPRVALAIIYIDTVTTYTGADHVVTDGLDLNEGELIAGDLFPEV